MKKNLCENNAWLSLLLSRNTIARKLYILIKHEFIPIHYSAFWNVPSAFFTEYRSEVYLFYRDFFDEDLDDYPPNYEVYVCLNITLEDALKRHSWYPSDYQDKVFIGEVPTEKVIFDRSTREFVNTSVFEIIRNPISG